MRKVRKDKGAKVSLRLDARWPDLTGRKFGRLTVMALSDKKWRDGQRMWKCGCECGGQTYRRTCYLFLVSNAGCELCAKDRQSNNRYVHGAFVNRRDDEGKIKPASRLYTIWNNMRMRCRNPKDPSWKRYGGRGIKVCEAWTEFANFRDWALSNGYANNLSVDRINVDGDYEPSNCEWITVSENSKRAWKDKSFEQRSAEGKERLLTARRRAAARAQIAAYELSQYLPIEFLWGTV